MWVELWTDAEETNPAVGLVDTLVFAAEPDSQPVEVENGLFQLELDFGEVFEDDDRWLQFVVACPSGSGVPTVLAPRTKITRFPQALFARQAATAQRVPGIDGHSLNAVDGSPVDAVFVDGSGRVGVRTSQPGAAVTISRPTQSASHQLELRNEGSIQSPNLDGIRFSQGANGGTTLGSINLLYRNNGHPDLSFSLRNDPDVLFLRAGGVVGIGTTTPSLIRALTIQGVDLGAYSSWLQFRDSAGEDLWHLTNEGGGLNFVETGVAANRLVLVPGGRTGIGIAYPDNTLHVHKGSAGIVTGQGSAPLVVENSTNAYVNILSPDDNESGVLFGSPSSNSAGGVVYNAGGTPAGLQFRTNGNVSRAAIDANGNMGIGTTSPAARLHLVGGSDVTPASGGHLVLGATNTLNLAFDQNEIAARNNGAVARLTLNADGGELILGGQDPDRVGVGKTNPAVKFDVEGTGGDAGGITGSNEVVGRFRETTPGRHTALSVDAQSGQDAVVYFSENGSAAWGLRADADQAEWAEGQFELRYHRGNNNTTVNQIVTGGDHTSFPMYHRGRIAPWADATFDLGSFSGFFGGRWKDVWAANAFIQTSDVREKKDIRMLDLGLAEVLRLRPVTFRWDRPHDDGGLRYGLIAQEVDQVIPNLVTKHDDPEALWGLSYASLVPVLIKAVQEQQQLIRTQQGELEALRRSITDVRSERDTAYSAVLRRLERVEASMRGADSPSASSDASTADSRY